MKSSIRRVAGIDNSTVVFLGPQEPRQAPDKSNGVLRPLDWALVAPDGAYALDSTRFGNKPVLTVV